MFKKPSELWKDDAEMQKAESSKQTFTKFVFPEIPMSEYVIDPKTKEKKLDAEGKPLIYTYNVFEEFIHLIIQIPECKAVLKATGFLDLDKIWNKLKVKMKTKEGTIIETEHPKIKQWREHVPQKKTLNLAQMFPDPFIGRKLYYVFVMFHQDYDVKITELEELDDKGKKKKKYERIYKTNEANEPMNKLGGFHTNMFNDKKFEIEFDTCTFQFEKRKERVKDGDGNDKIVEVIGKEMVYNKSRGYLNTPKLCDQFSDIEKSFIQHIESVDKTADKAYFYILTSELKAPTKLGQYAEHTCTVDAFVLPK